MRAIAALTLSVFLLVTYARVTDRPLIAVPDMSDEIMRREIVLSGDISGAALVTAPDGTTIADLSPQEGGFVSGVWRVVLRERRKHRLPDDGSVILIGHATGRISIYDPMTGWSADLMGFGADNARAFERLLVQQEGGQ